MPPMPSPGGMARPPAAFFSSSAIMASGVIGARPRWPAWGDTPLTVNLILGVRAGRRSNLAYSPKQFPSTLVKVVNMQRKRCYMLDVVGSGRLAGFSLRPPMRYGHTGHSDLACLGVKRLHQIAAHAAVPSVRHAASSHSVDVLRLSQPRFPISCHSRPQVRRSPEL